MSSSLEVDKLETKKNTTEEINSIGKSIHRSPINGKKRPCLALCILRLPEAYESGNAIRSILMAPNVAKQNKYIHF